MPFVEYGKDGNKRWVNTYQEGDIIHATHNIKDTEKVCHETQLVTKLGFVGQGNAVYQKVQYFYCVICGANIEDKEYIDG
tara:strand:+ start:519 stop:758 length:240 start_codon:yes stop_codon:yes gene_type:complete